MAAVPTRVAARRLSWLISLPAVRSAFVRPPVGAHRLASTLREPFWSPPPAAAALPSASLLRATCDHGSRSCRLFATASGAEGPSGARSTSPVMQAVDCPADSTTGPPMGSEEFAPQYDAQDVEKRLYEWWEQQGYFQPDTSSDKQCFVISMPPPNVTGRLHMGHAMFVALEDIIARFQRMRGRPTLWLPGTDHAGIATQMLVERALRADGIERKELGRDGFLERVWEWKGEYGGYITGQILGVDGGFGATGIGLPTLRGNARNS